MLQRASGVFYAVVATVFIWLAIIVATGIGTDAGMLSFLTMAAFGATIALWLTWSIMNIDQAKNAARDRDRAGKAKRHAVDDDDTRLALLLQLLDDEERDTLKARLREDLRADGEAVSLDDLLEERPRAARRG